MLQAPDHPTVYVSGDNASLDVIEQIAEGLGPTPVAVLFSGAVQLPHRFGGAYLTLCADLVAQAATKLGAKRVAAIHTDGWAHFSQAAAQTGAAFAGHGIAGRLVPIAAGETIRLETTPWAQPMGSWVPVLRFSRRRAPRRWKAESSWGINGVCPRSTGC